MTKERAREIWETRGQAMEFKFTPEEDAEVKAVWDTMPGDTTWVDALLRIADRHPFNVGDHVEIGPAFQMDRGFVPDECTGQRGFVAVCTTFRGTDEVMVRLGETKREVWFNVTGATGGQETRKVGRFEGAPRVFRL